MISAWFVSDIHLKDLEERNGQVLLRFLHSLSTGQRPATHLFLLGDIFDVWVGDHGFYRRRFRAFIEAIEKLKAKGIIVEYFEGNHDVHVKRFWQGKLGIPCWTDERFVNLEGLILRLEHGDLINPLDEKYLKYREFIRRPWMEVVAQMLPGRGFHAIADYASRRSRHRSHGFRISRANELREMIRRYAQDTFQKTPFDAIVTGHMHVRDDFKFSVGGRTARSLNLGSWFEEPTALHLFGREFKWVTLDVSESRTATQEV